VEQRQKKDSDTERAFLQPSQFIPTVSVFHPSPHFLMVPYLRLQIMKLILYSKPGCHLCEGLQEKLETIQQTPDFGILELEVRDITTREDWFAAYQYEVPVLYVVKNDNLQTIPRPSPRTTVAQLEKILRKYL